VPQLSSRTDHTVAGKILNSKIQIVLVTLDKSTTASKSRHQYCLVELSYPSMRVLQTAHVMRGAQSGSSPPRLRGCKLPFPSHSAAPST
jgi:hypothetical protein